MLDDELVVDGDGVVDAVSEPVGVFEKETITVLEGEAVSLGVVDGDAVALAVSDDDAVDVREDVAVTVGVGLVW